MSAPVQEITVSQLWLFPVKSCGGMRIQRGTVTRQGFRYDREWVVVRRRDNYVMTQRDTRLMKLITPTIDEAAGVLWLSTEANGRIAVPLTAEHQGAGDAEDFPLMSLEKWGLSGFYREVGTREGVAQWLSAALHLDVFLARSSGARNPNDIEEYRTVLQPEDRIQAHNWAALHLISEEGLDWVRGQAADPAVDAARFRPNIVVKGTKWPAEDRWSEFQIGSIRLRNAKGCTRCSLPCIDDSLRMSSTYQPTKALVQHHAWPNPFDPSETPMPVFGLNVFPDDLGEIHVGDSLLVRSEREQPMPTQAR